MVPKRVLFFLFSMQCGLSATYPAPISTIFEIKDVNRFPHAYTGEKFLNFCAGVFHIPKTAKWVKGGVFLRGSQLKRHNCGRWESFLGLADIPGMCLREFCCKMYSLGTTSQQKKPQILAIAMPSITQSNYFCWCSLGGTAVAIAHSLLWPPYVIGGPLYFCPVISIYLLYIFLSSFFSSPNLSGHRLDLYHTSTHGVALVRI